MDLAALENRVVRLEGWQRDLEHNTVCIASAAWVNEIEARVTTLEKKLKTLEDRTGQLGSFQSAHASETPLDRNWQPISSWPHV